MPQPIAETAFVPIAATRAAVEAYLSQPAVSRRGFAEFFTVHNLQRPEAYNSFYAPAAVVEAAGMVHPGQTTADYLTYLNVPYNLDNLLDAAMQDTTNTFRAAWQFLTNMGVSGAEIPAIVQRSKRLAHRVGSTVSAAISLHLTNRTVDPALRAIYDAEGNVHSVDLTAWACALHIRPYAGKLRGCPLLAERIFCPEGVTLLGAPRPTRQPNVYDFYWEALVDEAYCGMEVDTP